MHRSLIARSAIVFIALWLAVGVIVAPANADITISAAPSLLEVSATPGGFGSQDITVTNSGSEPFSVNAEITQYKGAEGALAATKWLTVDPASFELAPGERKSVRVTIAVPSDAGSGGRYAMVAFRTGGKIGTGSNVGVAAQVGVPFLVTVQGSAAVVRQPSLEGIVPVVEPNGTLGFRVPVSNKGNVHYYARGTVEVTETSGRPLGTLVLRDSTAILPGAKETLQSDQTLSYRDGATYHARAAISLGEGIPEGKAETDFTATTGLVIEEIVPRTSPAGEMSVLLSLKNTGGLGLLPRVMMAIRGEDGKVAGVLSPSQQPTIWPGQAADVQARYQGKLPAGNYTLVARVEYGTASVQREAPFLASNLASKPDSSLPVTKWAEAQAKPAPQQVAGALPISEIPVQPGSGPFSGSPSTLAIVGGAAVLGAVLITRRRSGRSVPVLEKIRLALPSPSRIGFGGAEEMARRRSRRVPHSYSVESLPPAPIHLLPPPVDWQDQPDQDWEPIEQPGSVPTAATGMPVRKEATPMSADGQSDTTAPSPSDTLDVRPRPRTRLARAVAEKAESLVSDASQAARAGDRAAVDRLSRQALKLDPWNVDAWLWLAASCQDSKSARLCLEAVLLLDPGNVRARRGLAGLNGGRSVVGAATID